MTAAILKWIIIVLSFINAGYLTYDGARALITGDYLRPKTGKYAGQLGPWTGLVTKIRINPMSTLMKSIFLLNGLAGLLITLFFALDFTWSYKAMLVYAACSSWNLFFGTVNSVLLIIMLIILRFNQ